MASCIECFELIVTATGNVYISADYELLFCYNNKLVHEGKDYNSNNLEWCSVKCFVAWLTAKQIKVVHEG